MSFVVQNVANPQVTRIPITGPAPYNTLVFCTYGGEFEGFFPKLTRYSLRTPSSFVLSEFSQDNPAPSYQHSTTAIMGQVGPGSANSTWQYAADEITNVGFDEEGRFFVDVDLAVMNASLPDNLPSGGFATFNLTVCSYILVQEPQPKGLGGLRSHGPGIHLLNPPGALKARLAPPKGNLITTIGRPPKTVTAS